MPASFPIKGRRKKYLLNAVGWTSSTLSIDGRLVGDIDFEAARERAGWTTPVPGGVGPMTVATLLQNTADAADKRDGIQST